MRSFLTVRDINGPGLLRPSGIGKASGCTGLRERQGIIFAAYSEGTAFATTNGGGNGTAANWSSINAGTDWSGTISDLATDPYDAEQVYVATDRGDVWHTPNFGLTWEKVTGNLPASQIRRIVLYWPTLKQTSQPWLFVATDAGVYLSSQQRARPVWKRFGIGLPDVLATDLQMRRAPDVLATALREGVLTVATYGRSAWEIAVPVSIQAAPSAHITSMDGVCLGGFPEGILAQFTVQLASISDLIMPLKFAWSVAGGKAMGGPDQATFSVRMLAAAQSVTVMVRVEDAIGYAMSDTLQGITLTPAEADKKEVFCQLISALGDVQKLPNWAVNPLSDPPRDRPVLTRRDLVELNRVMEDLAMAFARLPGRHVDSER